MVKFLAEESFWHKSSKTLKSDQKAIIKIVVWPLFHIGYVTKVLEWWCLAWDFKNTKNDQNFGGKSWSN